MEETGQPRSYKSAREKKWRHSFRAIVIAAAAFASLGSTAWAQIGAPGEPPQGPPSQTVSSTAPDPAAQVIPDHILFRHLFFYVAGLERFAAKIRADGIEHSIEKQELEVKPGLASDEAGFLVELTHLCNAELENIDRNIPQEEWDVVLEQEKSIVLSCMDQLSMRLGTKFEAFRNYVERTHGPNIVVTE